MQKTLFTLLGAILVLFVSAATAGAGTLLPEGLVIEDTYQHGFGQSVGRILLLQGEVIVIHQDESVGYRAKKGTPVYKMDTVISLKRSRCLVRMNDRSRLTLASNTRITLNRSLYKPAQKERSSYFKMALGKARFWVTKLTEAKRSEFKIKAATAVVGIRGSDFLIEIIEDTPQYSYSGFDSLTASLTTDLALNDAGGAPAADLGVRITTITPETRLVATSTVNPELSVRLEGLQQVTFTPEAMPTEVLNISPEDATGIMGDMPVDSEAFQQLPMQPAVTGQPAGQTAGAGAVQGEDEGAGEEDQGEGEADQDEGAGEEDQGEDAGEADQGEGEEDQGEAAGEAPADQAGSGDEAGAAPVEEPADAGEPAPASEDAGPEPLTGGESAAPDPDAPEPEIFVDDGELIEPEAIGEEVDVPAPIEPEVNEIVNNEQVENAQDAQQEIGQEIYEETVAEELPDFPATPQP